jgi:hypothetical protein
MEKENWINEILNSTNGMTQVTPNADLYSKIEQKIFLNKNVVSMKTVWLVAASIVILVSLNISAMQNKNATTNDTSETIISSTLNKSNQLY